jgi:hypothetical protein
MANLKVKKLKEILQHLRDRVANKKIMKFKAKHILQNLQEKKAFHML